uniref:Uncharacterized protein n=1 Tax=Bostrychia simpliciuscula TaxID=324754 RepID=A0A1Z1M7W1_9FLOR|nr:hypothetical protein [Bostrychia simpliciuscula]ARW62178.1 hypothetical protein [Bostrychia simpliciuscula]
MKKKTNFKKKIDLLLISIEAISIYKIQNLLTSQVNINYKDKNNLLFVTNLIKINQNIRNYYNNSSCNFIQCIYQIYIIYNFIQINVLNELILQILQKYKKCVKSLEVQQYLNKFTYIYFVKYEYYYTYKSLNCLYKININELAILNLYIIKKLQSRQGILILIKYLYL